MKAPPHNSENKTPSAIILEPGCSFSSIPLKNTLMHYRDSGSDRCFEKLPLSQIPPGQAIQLIKDLYSPEERFAKGFLKYRINVLKNPEELAWNNTLEELEHYIEYFSNRLDADGIYTIGYRDEFNNFVPVGMYCFKPLSDHPRGDELLKALSDENLDEHYSGQKAILHSFSLLNDFRNLESLKYVFILIALEALEKDFEHIFFFMSDYRLKSIYKRYGLEFPEIAFEKSRHVIGCYTLNETNVEKIASVLYAENSPFKLVSA